MVAKRLFLRINFNLLGISPATLSLAGGARSVTSNKYPVNNKTETLWLHTLDYDIYLREKDRVHEVDRNLGVFLDEYMPFHPDYLYMGVQPFIMETNDYYRFLCRFFKLLDDKYKMRIIIAAHPRSHYEKHPDYFDGRPVIKGKTSELIRDSCFVIAHASTSLNFAVLFKKPIIFVTTDELDKSSEGVWIHNIASLFGKRVYNLNKINGIDIARELNVNSDLYENYKNEYIKTAGSQELPFWQIFVNRIKNM